MDFSFVNSESFFPLPLSSRGRAREGVGRYLENPSPPPPTLALLASRRGEGKVR